MKGKVKKLNPKLLIAAAVVVVAGAAAFFLLGPGKGEEPPAPVTEYTLGGENISALTTYEGVSVEKVSGEEEEGEEATEEVYAYEGLEATGALIQAYAEQLSSEEGGFSVVDESCQKTDLPDFEADEGVVRLAKDSTAEEGKVLSMELSWSGSQCTVILDMPEGAVHEAESQGMTLMELSDYVKRLSPATLGLEGTSMDQYEVYVIDGSVLVDDRPCVRVNVYSKDNPEETNHVKGMYLMTGDGRHIYRLDQEQGTVEEL